MIERGRALRSRLDAERSAGTTVGFVPTMGAFHEGHLGLLKRAVAERDLVVVSIFVNPLQFGPGEDFEAYPRQRERDLALAEEAGAALAYVPDLVDVYPSWRLEVSVDPGPLGERLEGAARPGHFRGVATVVAKLFNRVGPSTAYFGEKDAQQLALIRRMVQELDFPVEIVGCPIVREPDGLAMSSRNAYLGPEDRAAATCLHRALAAARRLAAGGERDAAALRRVMARVVAAEARAELDYATVVDEATFEEVPETLEGPSRAVIAARVGPARLIDNERLRT